MPEVTDAVASAPVVPPTPTPVKKAAITEFTGRAPGKPFVIYGSDFPASTPVILNGRQVEQITGRSERWIKGVTPFDFAPGAVKVQVGTATFSGVLK